MVLCCLDTEREREREREKERGRERERTYLLRIDILYKKDENT
jgi:hypothetical protein